MAERWPGLLDRSEAAEYLGVSTMTISREKACGRLRSVGIRGMIKYRREDLDQYIRDLPEADGECPANAVREAREIEARNERVKKRRSRTEQPAA